MGTTPIWEEGVELGGRVRKPVKAHPNAQNLSIETEMLSLSVYEPIALQIFLGEGPSPNLGKGLS